VTHTTIPVATELPPFQAPTFERVRLSNGLDVILVRKAGLPVVDVQLVVRGGASLDPPALAGRASLSTEMLDEGTERHTALELSDRIELLGADFDLRVGWDATFLSLHGLVPRLGPLLEILAEVLLESTFPETEFNRKHDERMNLLIQQRDEPRAVASKTVARAVFGRDHIYGRPLSGSSSTMAGVERESLLEYYHTLAPTHTHLVAVGQIETDDVLRDLEKLFGSWSVTATPGAPLAAAPVQERTIHLVHRPGAPQSEVRVGHVGPARETPDYFPLLVLNTVLGGSFKSRLNMVLREQKGFTYGASSAFSFRRSGGVFSGGAAVFTDNTAETVEILLREITRVWHEGVSPAELERARRYLALGFVRTFETTGDLAGHLADLALYDLGEQHLQTYAARIGAVTQEQVAVAARSHLKPNELSIVVVGDRERVLEPLQRLNAGPIAEWEAE
jgi:zinc protease